jgi:hypothetical protein
MSLSTELAYDILAKDELIADLKKEVEYLTSYKEKYDRLLNDNLKYQQEMSGQVLTLVLNNGQFSE